MPVIFSNELLLWIVFLYNLIPRPQIHGELDINPVGVCGRLPWFQLSNSKSHSFNHCSIKSSRLTGFNSQLNFFPTLELVDEVIQQNHLMTLVTTLMCLQIKEAYAMLKHNPYLTRIAKVIMQMKQILSYFLNSFSKFKFVQYHFITTSINVLMIIFSKLLSAVNYLQIFEPS